jgi:hypothetical protein
VPRWWLLLDGSHEDATTLKRCFTVSGFSFDQIDAKLALTAPSFEKAADREEAISVGVELLESINVALRLSSSRYIGLVLHGLMEYRSDGTMHRTMFAAAAAFEISVVSAVGIVGTVATPVRSKEERLASLVRRDRMAAEIAHVLAIRPITWGAMNIVYETVSGRDYKTLIIKGWLSEAVSSNLYHTIAHNRHGFPRAQNKAKNPVTYDEACSLITNLLWRFVDEREPQ